MASHELDRAAPGVPDLAPERFAVDVERVDLHPLRRLRGDDPDFYMYTDRTFEGVRSRPWQGGQYGFVRNEVRTPAGVVSGGAVVLN